MTQALIRTSLFAAAQPSTVTTQQLYVRDDHGGYVEACDETKLAAARQVVSKHFCVGAQVIDAPRQAKDFLHLRVGTLQQIVFGVIYLNACHLVIDAETLFCGTLDAATVRPREVVQAALAHNAAAVISFHTHPSGVCEATPAEDALTQRLKEALALFDIRLLDHLIVGAGLYSFAEAGSL